MKKVKFKMFYMWMLYLTFLMVSCEKGETTLNSQADQLFRVPSVTSNISEGTEVTFSWDPIAMRYRVQISKDSLLFTNVLKDTIIESVKSIKFTDLFASTRYSGRIMCLSDDPIVKNSEWQTVTFLTSTENIFYTVPVTDISALSVTLRWSAFKQVTQIVVSTAGAADVVKTLTAAERSSGVSTVTGLASAKAYTFKIYLGTTLTQLRGTVTVTTKGF